MYQTWQGRSITAAKAKEAVAQGLSQTAQWRRKDNGLDALADYIHGLPDNHERIVDLARWCIAEGVLSLGDEARRYVEQFSSSSSNNAYDLLLAQVIYAQRRQNGPKSSEIRVEKA